MKRNTNQSLSEAAIRALDNEEAVVIYCELKEEGYQLFVSKKEYADIVNCCISTVDNQIKLGYGLPNYKKMGSAKNAKVMFSLLDVANYLASQTVKTA